MLAPRHRFVLSLSLSLPPPPHELSLLVEPPPDAFPRRSAETLSDFYQAYARSIQEIISQNATFEFEAIWAEHERTGRAYTLCVPLLLLPNVPVAADVQN